MLRLRIYQDSFDMEQYFSDIWFVRLHKSDESYGKSDETLIYALTFACEKGL